MERMVFNDMKHGCDLRCISPGIGFGCLIPCDGCTPSIVGVVRNEPGLNLRCKWLRETCESPFFMFGVLEF